MKEKKQMSGTEEPSVEHLTDDPRLANLSLDELARRLELLKRDAVSTLLPHGRSALDQMPYWNNGDTYEEMIRTGE